MNIQIFKRKKEVKETQDDAVRIYAIWTGTSVAAAKYTHTYMRRA